MAAASLMVLTSGAPASAQARPPIAYISMQRILVESVDARTAAATLDALRAEKIQERDAKIKEIDATKLALANAGGLFRATRRAELQQRLKAQEAALQQSNVQAQEDLRERQRALQASMRAELARVVSAIAVERGFQYVLNQDAVVTAPAGADVTTDVLARMNDAAARRSTDAK